jgi:hypothetical protein
MPITSAASGTNVLTTPVFQAVSVSGQAGRMTLPSVLEAVDRGDLVDLSGLKAHQRAAAVTVLAVIRTALRIYIPGVESDDQGLSSDDYANAWVAQLGVDAARICAPYNEVAFFQAPLLAEPHLKKSLDAVDVAFADVRHEVKGAGDVGDAEAWIYALWSGMMRIYVKDNVSGSRWGTTMLLPGDGVTIGSEISHLSRAYISLLPSQSIVERYSGKGKSAADHLIFLDPVAPDQKQIPLSSLAFPFVEPPRAVRLYAAGANGLYCAMQMTLGKPRVDSKAYGDLLLDPHVAASDVKPYKLIKGRRFDYRFLMNTLFAADKKVVSQLPFTLTFDRSYKSVRVCALSTDQGKTTGYFERTIVQRDTESVIGRDDDRLTFLAGKAVEITAKIQTSVVFTAATMMIPGKGDIGGAIASGAADLFRSMMDECLPGWVLDRASQPEDREADYQDYAAIVVPAVYDAVRFAEKSAPGATWIDRAKAWSYVSYALKSNPSLKGYNLMKSRDNGNGTPDFARRVMGALSSISRLMKVDPRASVSLRTMPNGVKSVQMLRFASQFPIDLFDRQQTAAADVILRGLGSIDHAFKESGDSVSAIGFGTVLARSGFPEFRLDRLISSHGDTLRNLATEAWTFAEAKGSTRADWSSIACLVIADAVGGKDADHASEWARMKLALEFIRYRSMTGKADDENGKVPEKSAA